MKKIYLTAISALVFWAVLQAQNETDALRFSQSYLGGTARSIGMGGAFGALGGDFTSLSLNPAGIGVYRSTELSFTPTIVLDDVSARYLGNTRNDSRYQFVLNNLGIVSTKQTGNETGWISITFGAGYNRINNFHRNTSMKGVMVMPSDPSNTTSSSFLDNLTDNANAYEATGNPDFWSEFYEQLAWDADLMPWDTASMEYWNDIQNAGYGQTQTRRIQESGGTGEFVFSLGANYGNRLYMGATFGIHRLNYSSYMDHLESDQEYVIDYFNSFTFRETLDTRGTGYTFKAGVIFRPVSLLRFGAAFHIPTFYNISEDFYTDMQSTFDDGNEIFVESANINRSEYRLRTPYRAIGSVAIQLPRLAIFSVDYEFVDYASANFDSRSSEFSLLDMNDRIKDIYKATHNLRAGAEFHLGPMYLRGGMQFYDSPYKKGEVNENAYSLGFSGGLGFRSEKVFFDVAYALRTEEYKYYLYLPQDVNGATINGNLSQFVATLGFRF